MHKIALVGAGHIGSRHLQALKLSECALDIHVVDPGKKALDIAHARWESAADNNFQGTVSFHAQMDALPEEIVIAIVATNSDVRLAVLKDLLNQRKPKHLVLEKFLFFDPDDFAQAEGFIEQSQASAFVNCPSRFYPHYQDIRQKLHEDMAPFNYRYEGSDFGLLCNAVHHLDLFSFFTGNTDFNLDFSGLDTNLQGGKRDGFVDTHGRICAEDRAGNYLHLCSHAAGNAQDMVVITNCYRRYIINFKTGQAMYADEDSQWEWRAVSYPKYYQSMISHWFVDDLIKHGTCKLPTYRESSELHLKFLHGLLSHLRSSNVIGEDELVRIT